MLSLYIFIKWFTTNDGKVTYKRQNLYSLCDDKKTCCVNKIKLPYAAKGQAPLQNSFIMGHMQYCEHLGVESDIGNFLLQHHSKLGNNWAELSWNGSDWFFITLNSFPRLAKMAAGTLNSSTFRWQFLSKKSWRKYVRQVRKAVAAKVAASLDVTPFFWHIVVYWHFKGTVLSMK